MTTQHGEPPQESESETTVVLIALESASNNGRNRGWLREHSLGANLTVMRDQLRTGTQAVIAAGRINSNDTRSFGIIDTAADDPDRVRTIRQRPAPETVDEPLAVVSRLVLRPCILDRLRPTQRARGEVDLGIATGQLATEARVAVHRITGHWVTVGDPRHYLHALRTYWEHHPDTTGAPRT